MAYVIFRAPKQAKNAGVVEIAVSQGRLCLPVDGTGGADVKSEIVFCGLYNFIYSFAHGRL